MYHEDQQRFSKDSPLSVIDSSGRQVSLLNDNAAAAAAAAAVATAAAAGLSQPLQRPLPTSHTSADYKVPTRDQRHISTVSPYSPSSSCSTSSMEDNGNRDQVTNSSSDIAMGSAAWQSQPPQQLQRQLQQQQPQEQEQPQKGNNRRKYHCTEPGCNKSFTTSGHLARHNRIHTGEKNFPCLFPGCQSRFSRQDNMMQHYRTHMSPKSRRPQRRTTPVPEEARPRPRLHAHHRIRSDPFGVEPPLTIDQHLSNYHRSLLGPSARTERFSPTRYSQADADKHKHKQQQQQQQPTQQLSPSGSSSVSSTVTGITHTDTGSTALTATTNITTPSASTIANTTAATVATSPTTPTSTIPVETVTTTTTTTTISSSSSSSSSTSAPTAVFYQYRPLTNLSLPEHSAGQTPSFSFTLLHPPIRQDVLEGTRRTGGGDKTDDTSSAGLLQLAHVVSTFG